MAAITEDSLRAMLTEMHATLSAAITEKVMNDMYKRIVVLIDDAVKRQYRHQILDTNAALATAMADVNSLLIKRALVGEA